MNKALETIRDSECPACRIDFGTKAGYMNHTKYGGCSAEDRFWARVDKSGRCWLFHGATDKWGYGHVGQRGRRVQAHRYAFLIAKGPIPDGQQVLHKCDTPLCVRPDHLFLGTNADNRADAIAKRRHAWGERNHSAKLTQEKVLAIRKEYRKDGPHKASPSNTRELAQKYGVGLGAIHAVVRGKTWRYL